MNKSIRLYTSICKECRITFLSICLCINLIAGIKAQCNTYVEMFSGPEGCVVPRIVSTQQILMPCSAPAGLNQLNEGDFAYIDYTETSCINICQFGTEVDITCFSLPVGIGDQVPDNGIKIFPTLVHSVVYIEGNDIVLIEVYNQDGTQIMKRKQPEELSTYLGDLDAGIYFIRIISKNRISVQKIVKL